MKASARMSEEEDVAEQVIFHASVLLNYSLVIAHKKCYAKIFL